MKPVHLINGALLAAFLLGSLAAWQHLPESIPVHFTASGRVTRWSGPTFWSWFALPLITAGIVAVNYLLAHYLPRWPHGINVPNKERFLALPPERQAPVIERLRDLIYGITAPVIGIMALVQYSMYRTAQGEPGQMYILLVLLAGWLLGPLVLAVWWPRINSELERQLREHEAAAAASRAN